MTEKKRNRLKTAIVLSESGVRGAVDVGALKVILKKIQPDVIIRTSVGSINDVVIAGGGFAISTHEKFINTTP